MTRAESPIKRISIFENIQTAFEIQIQLSCNFDGTNLKGILPDLSEGNFILAKIKGSRIMMMKITVVGFLEAVDEC